MSAPNGSDGHNGQTKRRGRPAIDPEHRRNLNITFRTSAEIKSKIEEKARINGRTVSQEIELYVKIGLIGGGSMDGIDHDLVQGVLNETCKTQISRAQKQSDDLVKNAEELAKTKASEIINSLMKLANREIEQKFTDLSNRLEEDIIKKMQEK